MVKALMSLGLVMLMACATAKQQAPAQAEPAPQQAEKAEPAPPPAPLPEPDDDVVPEGMFAYQIAFTLPDGWVAIPKEELPEGVDVAFIDQGSKAIGQIVVAHQPGTDAHKQAQVTALMLALQGAHPQDLVAEDDGSAWLTFEGATQKGLMKGIIIIEPWSAIPDVYITYSGMWLSGDDAHDALMLAQFRLIFEETEVTLP